MKYINSKKIFLPILIILTISVAACGKKESTDAADNKTKSETSGEKSEMKQTDNMSDKNSSDHIMINLPTMQCGTCKKNIESAVNKIEGIESINVVVKEKVAHINYHKSKTDLTKIESAITAAGYDANDKKADPEAYKELDDCCKLPKDQKENSNH